MIPTSHLRPTRRSARPRGVAGDTAVAPSAATLKDQVITTLIYTRRAIAGWSLLAVGVLTVVVMLMLPRSVDIAGLRVLFTALVLVGSAPMFAAAYQYAVIGFHKFLVPYDDLSPCYPRVAIILPCWNEELVVGRTIDRLLTMTYPADRLRVYAVDDASTDTTPDVIRSRVRQYAGQVFHLRRTLGGQGKAHTLNHGIEQILKDDWAEAVMIMDADVIFQADTLRKMTRHFSDPTVGAVTAYIKEGSANGNYLNNFIGYEYITAQAAARRAQNIFGAVACLAGGAQLHTRENLIAIGGRIETCSLAEDTSTTFKTQLFGKRVVFDANAIVWAEEPGDIVGLWKQRLRWGRGNVQISLQFAQIWFRQGSYGNLGRLNFALLWFTILLMPMFMLGSSIGLVALGVLDAPWAWTLFRLFWIWNAIVYAFSTLMAFGLDPQTARKSWLQGILFPGVISFALICYSVWPPLGDVYGVSLLRAFGYTLSATGVRCLTLFFYAWLSLCMPAAWCTKFLAGTSRFKWLAPPLLYLSGYGPFLCAVTIASYVKELRGASNIWDKTIKTGKVVG
jgi:cellulose synthase/poly-beta-1,6-N-acetylglucosamine synthase-like glycosyltransferase